MVFFREFILFCRHLTLLCRELSLQCRDFSFCRDSCGPPYWWDAEPLRYRNKTHGSLAVYKTKKKTKINSFLSKGSYLTYLLTTRRNVSFTAVSFLVIVVLSFYFSLRLCFWLFSYQYPTSFSCNLFKYNYTVEHSRTLMRIQLV